MARLRTYAKINWILDIMGTKDGFHLLDGVMETIGIYDELEINVTKEKSITTCYKGMDTMDGDLCIKAAKAFFEETGIDAGVNIYVEKHIPMGAGLGGGSSDCACVLCYLNEYFGNPVSRERLFELAANLGADVAFFIDGGAQRARGKGEILEPIEKNTVQHLVIARPKGKGVSTPEAFRLYDNMPEKKRGDVEGMITALQNGNTEQIAGKLFNALEAPSVSLLNDISTVKDELIKAGAKGAIMTGSGSAVIGVLENEQKLTLPDDIWYSFCTTVKKPREKAE